MSRSRRNFDAAAELADGFVRNASDVVKVGDSVTARVLKVKGDALGAA